jgi:hypothetical protein
MIGGSCCCHATEISEAELEGCWIGWLLLAEYLGGWKRFVGYIGRSVRKPPCVSKQKGRGIMNVLENFVCRWCVAWGKALVRSVHILLFFFNEPGTS